MFKFMVVASALIVYAAGCLGTMPKQCFTARYAVECQRIQLSALKDMRTINWDSVNSVRVF